jgi:hypothetical protein
MDSDGQLAARYDGDLKWSAITPAAKNDGASFDLAAE